MNIVSSFRMKEIDRISIEERGFGNLILMENAGIRILEAAQERIGFHENSRIVCVAGSGNNGGDALVIARQLYSSTVSNSVSVVILKAEGSNAFNIHLNICKNLGITIINASDSYKTAGDELSQADLIFDGLAGTGINGMLRPQAAALTNLINQSAAVKISIDIPSGIGELFRGDYPAVRADYSFTVGRPKRCLYLPSARAFCGIILPVRIGFPPELLNAAGCEEDKRDWQLFSGNDAVRLSPELQPGDYKNSRGHLAVFAGSRGFTGAASLCAEAALRTSAGLVSLFADEQSYGVLAGRHKAVMVKSEPEGDSEVPELSRYQAAAAGPGWGRTERRRVQLQKIIARSRGVLDADAISLLAEISAENEGGSGKMTDLGGNWVLTPHIGEFRRLFSGTDCSDNPYESVPAAAEKLNCVMLLKGITTFIAAPDGRNAVIDGCFPKLGTAGSGDLLCGIIGGYAASGMDLFDAAVLGASVHLRAAEECGKNRQWFTADEMIDYIGRSF